MGTFFKKRKIYFLYIRSESKVHLLIGLGAAKNLETCCCVHSKWRGGGKNENKWVESNPTRGRNQHSKAGIYSGRALSLSGSKKISLLFSLCDVFCHVQMKCMCKFVYATDRLEGTSVSYGQNCCTSHLLCERWHFFLSIILHSFFPPTYQSWTT